ncbi:MAG: S41 family peptidase [Clostridia bacterium]|nr:S41 family peptidase [Clostridia bacterium]
MKKGNSFWKVIFSVLGTSLVWAIVFNIFITSNSLIYKLHRATEIVDKHYIFQHDKDYTEDLTIAAYIASLGDKYSAFYTEDYYTKLQESMEGGYYGIGITIYPDQENNLLVVKEVSENSPAKEVGIQTGDILKKVGDIVVNFDNYNDALALIRGNEGTKISITFVRGISGIDYTVEVERKKIVTHTVDMKDLGEGICYIHIKSFDNETQKEFYDALQNYGIENIKYFILDLRYNGGGTFYSTKSIANMLLPKCTITTFEYKNGYKDSIKTNGKQIVKAPMCVLVNGSSASASEVLASALKDNKRAIIIGEKTFGKAIGQTTIPFEKENGKTVSAIYLTTSRYLTPGGDDIHGKGLQPDINVLPLKEYEGIQVEQIPFDKDIQLQRAISEVKSK